MRNLFLPLLLISNYLIAQPSQLQTLNQPIPINGSLSPSSYWPRHITHGIQKFYLYQVDFDIKINKIALNAVNSNPPLGCCGVKFHINISFYNYQGTLLYQQIGSLFELNNLPKDNGHYLVEIKLDSSLSITKGFYWIGFSGTLKPGESLAPASNCRCGDDLPMFEVSNSRTVSTNCKNDFAKIYLTRWTNSLDFPIKIPSEDVNIPCVSRPFSIETWYTSSIDAYFPVINFN